MSLYNRLANRKMELHMVLLWSLFVNQIIISICSIMYGLFKFQTEISESVDILLHVIIAVALVFITIRFRDSMMIKKLLSNLSHKSPNTYAVNDTIDYNKRTRMSIYLKNSDVCYLGIFKLKDETGVDFYITLVSYMTIDKNTKSIISDMREIKSSVMINSRDIERIEMFYEDDSEVWKWLNENEI